MTKLFNLKQTFPSTPNKAVYLSRSSAVVLFCSLEERILMLKRGKGCPDEVGKWVLPCGYVDWDENLSQAIQREMQEETGMNLMAIRQFAVENNLPICLDSFSDEEGTPLLVRSNPTKDKKQNISHYMVLAVREWLEEFPTPDYSQVDAMETEDVKWFRMADLKKMQDAGEIGFQHYEMVDKIVNGKYSPVLRYSLKDFYE